MRIFGFLLGLLISTAASAQTPYILYPPSSTGDDTAGLTAAAAQSAAQHLPVMLNGAYHVASCAAEIPFPTGSALIGPSQIADNVSLTQAYATNPRISCGGGGVDLKGLLHLGNSVKVAGISFYGPYNANPGEAIDAQSTIGVTVRGNFFQGFHKGIDASGGYANSLSGLGYEQNLRAIDNILNVVDIPFDCENTGSGYCSDNLIAQNECEDDSGGCVVGNWFGSEIKDNRMEDGTVQGINLWGPNGCTLDTIEGNFFNREAGFKLTNCDSLLISGNRAAGTDTGNTAMFFWYGTISKVVETGNQCLYNYKGCHVVEAGATINDSYFVDIPNKDQLTSTCGAGLFVDQPTEKAIMPWELFPALIPQC